MYVDMLFTFEVSTASKLKNYINNNVQKTIVTVL